MSRGKDYRLANCFNLYLYVAGDLTSETELQVQNNRFHDRATAKAYSSRARQIE